MQFPINYELNFSSEPLCQRPTSSVDFRSEKLPPPHSRSADASELSEPAPCVCAHGGLQPVGNSRARGRGAVALQPKQTAQQQRRRSLFRALTSLLQQLGKNV